MMLDFDNFFVCLASEKRQLVPYDWQRELATHKECSNRLIRIPTGFGKTIGVLAAWMWNRVRRQDDRWPRRLVWCLPMRVLVEQTEHAARECLTRLGLLWDNQSDHSDKVGVHLLMGGMDAGLWYQYPEHAAVLIGTQDMLLSRALNRGYGASRARWPMDFGLLNQDCLWVMDEVQLMDVGLATSAQIQAFRENDTDAGKVLRPCFTWWMSATLQHEWIERSPDTAHMAAKLSQTVIPAEHRTGHLWDDVTKSCRIEVKVADARELANLVVHEHIEAGRGASGPTLVVLNTVEGAVEVAEGVREDERIKGFDTDVRLVHSRFRPAERASWREEFLNRAACAPGTDLIIIATQVVEAGVDFSAAVLITELAPWPSLVQRFGRCARWGGKGQVIIVDTLAGKARRAIDTANAKQETAKAKGKKTGQIDEQKIVEDAEMRAALPYGLGETRAAREPLKMLSDVAILPLEALEEGHPEMLPDLYPYDPPHLLLRHEMEELFDTTPDLSGADVDISRFIRSGEERDLHVFWSEIPEKSDPSTDLRPARHALCAVPYLKARDWLCGKETSTLKAPRLKNGMRAWVWDWLDGVWRKPERRDLYPGQIVLVEAHCGGYHPKEGWSPKHTGFVEPVEAVLPSAEDSSDSKQDDESLSANPWQTIAVHGREAGTLARAILSALSPDLADLFDLAGRWHDMGKVHQAFQGSIAAEDRPDRQDLAKAPKHAWPKSHLYRMESGERRPGFRHELASTLALFALLQRHFPDHSALLGPWRDLLTQAGMTPMQADTPESPPNPLEREILALEAERFNLLAYLVCSHHGKVRISWHACPADQASGDGELRIRGIRSGDTLTPLAAVAADHSVHLLPEYNLDLSPAWAGLSARTGPGWTERVLSLLDRHGPFVLAWLEALLRAADQRTSSRVDLVDELLSSEVNREHPQP